MVTISRVTFIIMCKYPYFKVKSDMKYIAYENFFSLRHSVNMLNNKKPKILIILYIFII